jgi:osmotically-inducible protein OsmY
MQQLGMMGALGRGGMMGLGMGMGQNMMGGMGGQQNQQKTVRTHLRLGFESPGQPLGTVNARFSDVVQRVLDRTDVGGGRVSVTLEGSTAVLTGTVSSKHARDVIARLALLEPGIGAVRNELTVNPDAPTPESGPTPNTAGQRP